MKKISILLLAMILFNFIFCNYFTYADDEETVTYSKEAYDKLTEEGTAELGGEDVEISVSFSTVGSASGTVAAVASPFFMVMSNVLNFLAKQGGITGGDGYTELDSSAYNTGMFTICSLVFGEYLLFSVDIFQTNSELNPDVEATFVTKAIDTIKNAVSVWYNFIRVVSVVLLGIVIAVSAVTGLAKMIKQDDPNAESRAKMKITLEILATGLLFMVLCPEIISAMTYVFEAIMDFLWDIRYSLEANLGYSSFETECLNICLTGITQYGGMQCLAYLIEYVAFVVIQIKFFGMYIFRLFKMFILVVTAPISTATDLYIRLNGGNDRGSLRKWIYEYLMCLLMQPIQAILYLIFMFTLSEFAINAPLIGVIFLWMLLRAEKIVKFILDIDYGKITRLFSQSAN